MTFIDDFRKEVYKDYTVTALKTMIIVWAILVIFAVLFYIDNKWLLAGILAYEVLP